MYENPLMDMPREHPVTASRPRITRREFARRSLLAGPVIAAAPAVMRAQGRRITTGVIGCGSVSNSYLPVLAASPHVELVSVCDIRPDRARRQAERFSVPHHYPHIDQMLAGAPFEFLVDLTDMQEHERLNRQALEAGRHVWSEKPIANSLSAGQAILALSRRKGVRLWGAPTVVNSPQFAFMAGTIQVGSLGQLSAAHAHYGHDGPDWAAFFYQRGGGSMPDLAVYNLTTLTGLLGPARHVAGMLSIVTPTRQIQERGAITVEAEDNAMLLLDHGNGVISHVMSGFNYYNPYGHQGRDETRHTVTVIGRTGFMGMVGYDWEPQGVDVATASEPRLTRHATDAKGYVWQQGAALAAESLATGRQLLVTPEHALHVLEVITAARESQETGRRVALTSTFGWPVGV